MPKLIATHSGTFHADDVFGVAVLAAIFPASEIVRTRDPDTLDRADYVVDVGGTWDPARGRFDHHQRGFDGARTRTGPDGSVAPAEGYASAGLVWREYGCDYVRQAAQALGLQLEAATAARVAADIDTALVRHIDLVDLGAAEVAPGAFGLSSQLALLNSTWLEAQGLDPDAVAQRQLERFGEAMATVRRLLDRLVLRTVGQVFAADQVRAAERLLGGRVLLLADGGLPWTRVVGQELPQVLLVVAPAAERDRWQLRTVPLAEGSFANRMDLPAAWAGLRDDQLAAVSGVADAAFCHRNRFIAVARTLAGALRLAELALDSGAAVPP